MMSDAMSDIEALKQLRELGAKFRNQPLETFSTDSLVKELEKRGYWCFDMRIEKLNFGDEILDLGQL